MPGLAYEDNGIDGWMVPKELRWLYNAAKNMDSIVEIGSWKGRSTHALLSGCPGTVYAVDHFQGSKDEKESTHKEAATEDIYSQFMENVGSFPNLRIIRADSIEAAEVFNDKSVDMVFIDGGHTYDEVKADIAAWLPKAKKIICGHDYFYSSVCRAVEEIFGGIDSFFSIWFKPVSQ